MDKMNWPTATVAIFGTALIVAAAVFLKNPDVLWALVALYWYISD